MQSEYRTWSRRAIAPRLLPVARFSRTIDSMNKKYSLRVWVLFIFSVLVTSGRPSFAGPTFAELRASFQQAHLPQPTVPGHDDLGTYQTWNCSSVYYDSAKPGFSAKLFNFRTCLENNYCYYNNEAQRLPTWFPAWFGFENNGEFDTTADQFSTDQSISTCVGDIRNCALKKGTFKNNMYIRIGSQGELLIEWSTSIAPAIPYASIALPSEKAVLYSTCSPANR